MAQHPWDLHLCHSQSLFSSQGNGTFNSIPELAVERMAQVIQGEQNPHEEEGCPPWGKS